MLKTLLGLGMVSQDETKTVDLQIEGEVNRLKMHIHNGQLSLRHWNEKHVSAEVHVRVRGDESHPMEKYWHLHQRGQEIVFEQETQYNWFFGPHVRIDVIMNVPQEIKAANLKTHNGFVDIELFNGTVHALTHNGVVRLADIEGDVQAFTHNGHIEALRIDGSLHLTSHNGMIDIDKVTESVQAKTHNGKIQAKDCGQNVTLGTHNGAIHVEQSLPLNGDWGLVTHHGNIHFHVPRDTDATYKLHTSSGRIKGNAIPVQTSGYAQKMTVTTGKGTHKIDLHTKSGNIEVQQPES